MQFELPNYFRNFFDLVNGKKLDNPSKRFASALSHLKNNFIIRAENEVLEGTGYAKSFLSDIKSGKKLPNREILEILQGKFGINSNWILTGKGEMLQEQPATLNEPQTQYPTTKITPIVTADTPLPANALELMEMIDKAIEAKENEIIEKLFDKIKTALKQ